jgi:NADH-quinone oxidoreductase subunit N
MDALIVIFITALIGLFVGMMKKPNLTLVLSVIGLSAAFILMSYYGKYNSVFNKFEGLEFDSFHWLFAELVIALSLLIIVGGFHYFKKDVEHTADYYGLLLFSLCGALVLIGSTNFFMFFLGIEIMSIPVYVLVGIKKQNILSSEASIKYFFTGSFATAILLFGVALVYGATGTFDFSELSSLFDANSPMAIVGILFIFAALLFKIGSVPFHFWSPDVYEGSPDPVTAFMATVVKVAGLTSIVSLFAYTFGTATDILLPIFYVVTIGSLFLGYLSALKQTNFRRLMAYSGISNTGFAMLTLLSGNFITLWVFLLGYTAATVGLLTISQILEKSNSDEIVNWKGIGYKNPFIGIVLLISFLSLAGIPPFTGFFAKLLLLINTYQSHPILVYLTLVTSVIGAFLYIRFILNAFAKDSNAEKITIHPLHILVLSITTIVVLSGWTLILF